jgi:serine/threonine-protein kinase
MSVSVETLVGQRIADRYQVIELVGRGAMGEVYAATQLSTGRRCALKILRSELLVNVHVLARFEREAQLAARLTHPNTVVVYDSGRDGDRIFIAMELLEGRSLEHEIRAGQFAPARAVLIAAQICESLAEAHRAGIVHRDLKPNNILLIDRAGNPDFVKVCDFGIARQYEGGSAKSGLTTEGLVYGTPSYMSPEQLRGTPLDGRSDVYALGVILYEMMTSNPPFSADSVIELANKHLVDDPPWFQTWGLAAPVPEALEAVVRRAMSKVAADRFDSMEEMSDALLAAVPSAMADRSGSVSMPVRRPRTLPPAAVAASEEGSPSTERRKSGRLRYGIVALVVATALLGVAAGAALLLGTRLAIGTGPSPVPPGVKVRPGVVRADDHEKDRAAAGADTGSGRGTAAGSAAETAPATGAATAAPAETAPASAGPPGRLTLSVKPWADVYEGKKHLGTTPIESASLRAGKHVLTLVNEKLGVRRTITVTLRPGEELKLPVVDLAAPAP